MGKSGIPDRWTDYTPVGDRITGTRFVAFKVPLKPELCRNLMEPHMRFTPACLMERLPNLCAVIDLTNTDRYYCPSNFISKQILYKKIYCEGKVIPSGAVIQEFYKAVDEALEFCGDEDVVKKVCSPREENMSSLLAWMTILYTDSSIGVHCTHGLNRTGYLICKYMIERLHIPPTQAIKLFEDARGYPMEREQYINDLLSTSSQNSIEKSRIEKDRHSRIVAQDEMQAKKDDYFSSNVFHTGRPKAETADTSDSFRNTLWNRPENSNRDRPNYQQRHQSQYSRQPENTTYNQNWRDRNTRPDSRPSHPKRHNYSSAGSSGSHSKNWREEYQNPRKQNNGKSYDNYNSRSGYGGANHHQQQSSVLYDPSYGETSRGYGSRSRYSDGISNRQNERDDRKNSPYKRIDADPFSKSDASQSGKQKHKDRK